MTENEEGLPANTKGGVVLRLVIDTCVWLDLAKDYRQQPVIYALEDLVKNGDLELIVPQIILDEFERNKSRVMEETRRSLQSHFRLVKEAVNQFGEDDKVSATLFGPLGGVDDEGTIAVKIADRGVDLSERDPHGMAVEGREIGGLRIPWKG